MRNKYKGCNSQKTLSGGLIMTTRNVEQVLVYNNFMTMEVLRNLTVQAYEGSKDNTLNIYIDMYRMIMDLYQPNLEVKTMSIITSTMINLCAHLRSYYRSRHRVETNIFLVYSNISTTYNKTFYPGYNAANDIKVKSNAKMTDTVEFNIRLLEILCPYLPDIHFVRGAYEPSVIILDLIYKEEASGNIYPNLVFSRDDIALQLPACHPNTTIFLNSKRTGMMMYANKSNAIWTYLSKTGRNKLLENQAFLDKISNMDTSLLGLIIALTNLPGRSIKSEYDINKAINIVYSAITRKSIFNGRMANPLDIYNGLFIGQECKISADTFAFRYKAVDLLTAHQEYMFTHYAKDISYKSNLSDVETVQAINNKYFYENPLDLNRL